MRNGEKFQKQKQKQAAHKLARKVESAQAKGDSRAKGIPSDAIRSGTADKKHFTQAAGLFRHKLQTGNGSKNASKRKGHDKQVAAGAKAAMK